MKRILFLLASISTIVGCRDKTSLKENKVFFPNGKLKLLYYTENDKKNGDRFEYDRQGNLITKFKFKNDVQCDTAFYYYADGKLNEFQIFKEGKRVGNMVRYWPNGAVQIKSQFINNLQDGLYVKLDSIGDTLITINYRMGKILEVKNDEAFQKLK
jgi:antitoxin component YwqK of YwqJK toxin-antitoxin module